jgi:hypothetical protein
MPDPGPPDPGSHIRRCDTSYTQSTPGSNQQPADSIPETKDLSMTTPNPKSNEATPFVTKADFEDFLASYKTDLDAIKTDLEAFATKISKTLLDALAADKEDRLNMKVMADSRMDVLESILNSIRPPIRYDDSEEEEVQ